jgi:hypothetical protein
MERRIRAGTAGAATSWSGLAAGAPALAASYGVPWRALNPGYLLAA